MDISKEKAAVSIENSHSFHGPTFDATSMDKVSDSGSNETKPKEPTQHMSDDQYPHGLKLALLAGASLFAVFLIALDQVSSPSIDTGAAGRTTNLRLF